MDGSDDITAGLMRLGFSEAEARTYVALTRSQPATAYALAKLSGLPRANSYGAVSALVVRGAIRVVSEVPVRYAVTDAQHFFPAIARDVADTARDVAERVADVSRAARRDYVETLEGDGIVGERINAMIDAATSHLHLKTRDTLCAPHLPHLKRAADRGVVVTVVASGDAWGDLPDHSGVTVVPHEGTGSAPSEPHQVMLTLTTDAGEALIADLDPPARAYVAASPTLVYVIRTMILHEIYLAEIATAMGPEALKAAGVDMESLRARLRPAEHGLDVSRPVPGDVTKSS